MLSETARKIVEDRANDIYLSVASGWELAIKVRIGKLTLAQPVNSFVAEQIAQYAFKPLTVEFQHTYRLSTLPRLPQGQHPDEPDPFDLLLIAQGLVEGLAILTPDPKYAAYGVRVLW
jgi:PIN domain nuclease of toxin-antitoxin system